ncbi:hypothetical protein Poli38472_013580 [Pythium oligandrum]|uniref:ATPase F1/V1/A1 complex alpha/beta subunit nucleotide-binding domain-containing protein n=1 Tax=Pythium oligandrum TaxID=41045 RepID=A0A8K1CD88_PYTOL|nr:hypothetical protein Poli38472_013580 [Pythium oligandrum]|eukprot:TMW61117.1 hypothetical protein Poli38472_013580 [Pythium oligandrum]
MMTASTMRMRRALTLLQRSVLASMHAETRVLSVVTKGVASGVEQTRTITTTRGNAQAKKTSSESSEAMLMQQMLDAMGMDEEEEETKVEKTVENRSVESNLPLTGVIMEVKNNIASISGLRHATIGSVVSIYAENEDDDAAEKEQTPVCRGIVLFLEKKAAHVALFSDNEREHAVKNVGVGMPVRLEEPELRIPASLGRLTGRAIDPLGNPIELVFKDEETDLPTANDRVSIAWGSKTVPGLMTRAPFKEAFTTGILALDCLKPLAFGHRFGIFGPKNSGKTRMTLDVIAQQVRAAKASGKEPPHFVYVSIGKSPARVQQILQFLEQTDALQHTTIVSADERDSLIMQYLAPFTGCALAEYFMKQSKSNQSVVIYDDLAMHTTVVESLVQTMKLPKVTQLSLSGHTVLMERSAQFLKPTPSSSLTTFALADTPDSATGEVSELKERLMSFVDDSVVLESQLALQRVYPPIDVLQPGTSVRGPPFQSAAMWTHVSRLRARINESFHTKEHIDVSAHLGLEIEPEDAEVLEFQALARQFFEQTQLQSINRIEKELGVFYLTTIAITKLPPNMTTWELVRESLSVLQSENPELVHMLEDYPSDKAWTKETEDQLENALERVLAEARKRHQLERSKDKTTTRVSPAVLLARRQRR